MARIVTSSRAWADGMTYQQIADAVGVSVYTAHSAASDIELLENKKLPGADGKFRPTSYAGRADFPFGK